MAAGLGATLLPARRATRVDPMVRYAILENRRGRRFANAVRQGPRSSLQISSSTNIDIVNRDRLREADEQHGAGSESHFFTARGQDDGRSAAATGCRADGRAFFPPITPPTIAPPAAGIPIFAVSCFLVAGAILTRSGC